MFRILIVEDKEVFRRKIKRLEYFKTSDAVCEVAYEAQNGEEALEILRNHQVDIVITDIRMPIMDGIEALKIIKNDQLAKCVILLSEYTDFAYAKDGIVYGAFDYIVKPIDNDKITDVLNRACEYLHTIQSTSTFWEDTAQLLVNKISENDSNYADLLENIFDGVRTHNMNLTSACGEMKHMMVYIEKNVIRSKPHMIKFAPVAEICLIRENCTSLEELFTLVSYRIDLLFREMNKFALHTTNSLINNICGYIINNIEQGVNLQTLSEEFFINKKYLSTCFKRETDVGFVEYVTYIKIERAKMLLMDKTLKVYEVAAKLGFSDTEYFSRVFKEKTGKSPTAYYKEDVLRCTAM